MSKNSKPAARNPPNRSPSAPPSPPTATAEAKRAQKKRQSKEEVSQSPFSVTVGHVYDGPLDLLLDLIRKQNIDIYDIPIARITSQFLDYTQHLKQVDVDAAGEFIYWASLLIHIKSKTLLPRDPSDVVGGESRRPTPRTGRASPSSTSALRRPPRCFFQNSRSKRPPGPTQA